MGLPCTHRHITSTKTNSDKKRETLMTFIFWLLLFFIKTGISPRSLQAQRHDWIKQANLFRWSKCQATLFPWIFDQCIQTNCCNIVDSLKNPDRWRAKTDSPPFAPIHPFFLASLAPTRSVFLCTDFDPDSHLKRTSIRKCRHFLFLLRIKVGFEWMSTYSFWAAREITSMFLVFDFLRSGVFLSKLWEAICV